MFIQSPDPLAPQPAPRPAPRPAPHQASDRKAPPPSSHPVWETRWPALCKVTCLPHIRGPATEPRALSAGDWASTQPHRRGASRPEPVLAAGTIPSRGPLPLHPGPVMTSMRPGEHHGWGPGPVDSLRLCLILAESVSLHQLLRLSGTCLPSATSPHGSPSALLPKVASHWPGPPLPEAQARRRGVLTTGDPPGHCRQAVQPHRRGAGWGCPTAQQIRLGPRRYLQTASCLKHP